MRLKKWERRWKEKREREGRAIGREKESLAGVFNKDIGENDSLKRSWSIQIEVL